MNSLNEMSECPLTFESMAHNAMKLNCSHHFSKTGIKDYLEHSKIIWSEKIEELTQSLLKTPVLCPLCRARISSVVNDPEYQKDLQELAKKNLPAAVGNNKMDVEEAPSMLQTKKRRRRQLRVEISEINNKLKEIRNQGIGFAINRDPEVHNKDIDVVRKELEKLKEKQSKFCDEKEVLELELERELGCTYYKFAPCEGVSADFSVLESYVIDNILHLKIRAPKFDVKPFMYLNISDVVGGKLVIIPSRNNYGNFVDQTCKINIEDVADLKDYFEKNRIDFKILCNREVKHSIEL